MKKGNVFSKKETQSKNSTPSSSKNYALQIPLCSRFKFCFQPIQSNLSVIDIFDRT